MSTMAMTTSPVTLRAPRPQWAWVLGVLLVTAAVLPRVGYMARPFESDSGLYVYMGKVVCEGRTIYRDFYETKPPGVPLLTAGLFSVFGHHWAPYVALQAVLAVWGAYLLSRIVSDATKNVGALGALFFAIVFLNFSPVAYRGFQLETVTASLACAGAYFGWRAIAGEHARSAAFWCGTWAGAAASLKPTAGAVFGAMVLAMLWQRRRSAWPAVIAGAAGFAWIPGASIAWAWGHGVLGDLAGLMREISLYGSQTPIVLEDLFKPAVVAMVASFPFIVGWWVYGRRRAGMVSRDSRDESPTRNNSTTPGIALFALLWLVLEALGVYLQKRMYTYHFLPIVPPLAVLFGVACARWNVASVGRIAAMLCPIVLISVAHSLGDMRELLRGEAVLLPESRWLLVHARPGDTVVGDPIERLLMETGLRCGSRYAHLFYFANHDLAPAEYGARFMEDLERNKPTWAVFDARRSELVQWQTQSLSMFSQRPMRTQRLIQAWEAIEAHLAAHYREAARAGTKVIYERSR